MKENRLIYGTMGIGGGWTSDTLTESAIKTALDCGRYMSSKLSHLFSQLA